MQAPFTVTISPQSNEHLTVLVEAMHRLMPPGQESPAKAEAKPKKAKAVATETAASTATENQDVGSISDPAPAIDLMTVRARLAELSRAGKADQVKKLIAEMGAQKLTDISSARYAELMEKAGAL
jgi:hypothetical protein